MPPYISLPEWDEDRAIFTASRLSGCRRRCEGGEDLTVFFVVAQWNSCLSPLLPSPLLLFLSITAGVMRLPWACSATEAQSQWIIIFKIHQQGGGNFERLGKKKRRTKTAKIEKKERRSGKKLKGHYISQQQAAACILPLTTFHLKMRPFFSSNIARSHHICFPPYCFCAQRTHSLAVKASVLSQLVRKGPCQAFHTISN